MAKKSYARGGKKKGMRPDNRSATQNTAKHPIGSTKAKRKR